MKHIPTDLKILNKIYESYYHKFVDFSKDHPERNSKIYVPINIDIIAKEFNTDVDIIFGRLYYHLDKKHGYKNEDGSLVHLFARVVGSDKHCVHFPLVASVLADLRRENKKFGSPQLLLSFLWQFPSVHWQYRCGHNKRVNSDVPRRQLPVL